MKIAHVSDIHFRPLNRHDEFREVFEIFAQDCEKKNVDHIYVGGDIYHNKLHNISPEFIDLFVWWMNRLSSVAPLHMILGNHDGVLSNKGRQDAISPIVSAVNNSRVFLYKKSGVYQFAPGYNWCVFSLFDEEIWDMVKPVPGDVNIACYHGPIAGAFTELEYEIEDGISVDFFKERGFKYAFLGDIHKMQFLDYR